MMFGVRNIKRIFLFAFFFYMSYLSLHKEDRGHEENKMEKLNSKKNEFEEIVKGELTEGSDDYRLEASEFNTEQSESQSEQMVDEVKTDADGKQIKGELDEINHDEIEENIENNQSEIAEQKLPKIAILGVKKCGTIALSQMMKMHPKIMVPSDPEIWFWTYPKEFRKGLDHYKNQMPFIKGDQMTVVATPGILDKPEDTTYLRRLHDSIPDVKVLLVVKNPIDRVVSDILHEFSAAQHKDEIMPDIDNIIMGRSGLIQQRGLSGLSLNEMVFYLSNYTMIYQMVSQVFPRKNILVVNGDKLVTDPLQEIRRVESFLGLDPFYRQFHFVFPENGRFPCFKFGEHNLCMDPKHKGREHPTLKRETLAHLQKHFQPMVDKFFNETDISIQNFMDKFKN